MTARVYENGRRLALGAGATSAHWINGSAWFALSDGALHIVDKQGPPLVKQVVQNGAILCATPHPVNGGGILIGDDAGFMCEVEPEALMVLDDPGGWVEHIVASPVSGVIAAASGKTVSIYRRGQVEASHKFTYPSTVGGLALDAKGRRLAASHYGGVTVRYALMPDDKGVSLKWAGSHLACTISPDAEYVITGMQENSLHGWRLPEKTDLRMTGYAAKTKSFSWNKSARLLATSGADCAVVWPFVGKLGPQGKEPMLLGARKPLVTQVAFHPSEDILAIGYADGAAHAIRLSDQIVIELDEPGEGAVTALAWSADGLQIAIGDEAGRGAIVDLSA